MNVFIFALGTKGDIHPMIGVGQELMIRGHNVTFLTNDYFKFEIIDAGLNFFSIGNIEQYHKGNNANAWLADNVNQDNFEHYHAPSFEPSFNYTRV